MILKNLNTLLIVTGLFMFINIPDASAQVTIRVIKFPKNSPTKDSIFIAGSFNNWNANDSGMQLRRDTNGNYSVTFYPVVKYFEYKFTRGAWSSVEGDKNGNTIPNRSVAYAGVPITIDVAIESWTDYETIKIRVVELPSNTPDDAALYITGPFNHWNPTDSNYKLERLADGVYQYVLPHGDSISFKFTRGSFSTMESDRNGRSVAAHILVTSKLASKTNQYTIAGWEDLSESRGNVVESILLLAAFIGLFASLALSFLKNAKKDANNLLAIILVIISVMLVTKILLYYRYFYYQTPKLILLPLFLLFTISPLINVYAKRVLHYYERFGLKEYLIFFTPLVILFIGLMPLLAADKNQLVTLLLNHHLDDNLRVVVGISVVYNIYYIYNTLNKVKSAKLADEFGSAQRTYSNYIFCLILINTIVSLLLTALFFISIFINDEQRWLVEAAVKISWLGLSIYPFAIGWFMMTRPEIFSINLEAVKGKTKDSLSTIKTKLDELMENKKPFLDPELRLNDLAGLLQTNPHILSRLINEDDSTNFYDFINEYRINEFKKRCEHGQHKTMTIIAIANEVGFKSKTTFNRTFKKINGITPRDYLNTLKADES